MRKTCDSSKAECKLAVQLLRGLEVVAERLLDQEAGPDRRPVQPDFVHDFANSPIKPGGIAR